MFGPQRGGWSHVLFDFGFYDVMVEFYFKSSTLLGYHIAGCRTAMRRRPPPPAQEGLIVASSRLCSPVAMATRRRVLGVFCRRFAICHASNREEKENSNLALQIKANLIVFNDGHYFKCNAMPWAKFLSSP